VLNLSFVDIIIYELGLYGDTKMKTQGRITKTLLMCIHFSMNGKHYTKKFTMSVFSDYKDNMLGVKKITLLQMSVL
jgi:hypothetical protein